MNGAAREVTWLLLRLVFVESAAGSMISQLRSLALLPVAALADTVT